LFSTAPSSALTFASFSAFLLTILCARLPNKDEFPQIWLADSGGLSSATFQSSTSAGDATPAPAVDRGGWTSLYNGSRKMGVPVRRRQLSGPHNSRFLSQPEAAMKNAAPPGDVKDAERPRTRESRPASIHAVLEQSCRAGPLESEPRIRAIRRSVGADFRDRAAEKINAGTVQCGRARQGNLNSETRVCT